jgi:hypothetical protein
MWKLLMEVEYGPGMQDLQLGNQEEPLHVKARAAQEEPPNRRRSAHRVMQSSF